MVILTLSLLKSQFPIFQEEPKSFFCLNKMISLLLSQLVHPKTLYILYKHYLEQMTKSENMWVSLTMVSTSYKNSLQYAVVPLSELVKENALSLATILSIVPLKLLLTVPVVSLFGLILYIAKFIDERKC